MSNELLLVLSLAVIYGLVLVFYVAFGAQGLLCWTAIATLCANIEVLLLIDGFGMEQTLGNILFASTFLVTDILSETAGKQQAHLAVNIGIAASLVFILISQSWLLYLPSPNDWAMPHFQAIFSNTPRVVLTSFVVYAIVQRIDVWLYHRIWALTARMTGDSRPFLWLRNNGSTMISQLLNALLFTFGAFGGMYDLPTLLSITGASYVVFIVTSLADTPVVYLARRLKEDRE